MKRLLRLIAEAHLGNYFLGEAISRIEQRDVPTHNREEYMRKIEDYLRRAQNLGVDTKHARKEYTQLKARYRIK